MLSDSITMPCVCNMRLTDNTCFYLYFQLLVWRVRSVLTERQLEHVTYVSTVLILHVHVPYGEQQTAAS